MLQMKYTLKYILSILLSASLLSCENTIELTDDDFEPRLSLTFLGSDGGESTQRFFVSEVYRGEDVRLIEDAKIELYVNEKLSQTITKSSPLDLKNESSRPENNPYMIKRDFKAGDKLRFVVSHPDYPKAEANVIIPQRPIFTAEIKDVVRESCSASNTYLPEEQLQIRVKLKDVPNQEDYYRLKIHLKTPLEAKGLETTIAYKEDLILMEGKPESKKEKKKVPIFSESYENEFLVFSDKLFKDKEGEITVYTFRPKLCKVYVTIEHLERKSYRYLQAITKLSEESNPFVTPTVFPTNVKGGVGIVSVAGSNTIEFTYIPKVKSILK